MNSQQSEWRSLFDGRTTSGWRGYQKTELPAGWQVVDGALTRVAAAGDIITTEQFRNFELELEWQVKAKGKSGIFYRATEATPLIYHNAPEYQVLDDAGHADGKSRMTAAGSNYGLHPSPAGHLKPAGEWNRTRIVVDGNHVEHWLNGAKVVEYELHSPEWKQLVASSKFNQWREYAQSPEGHIGLQDHGDRVAYRAIRLRELR